MGMADACAVQAALCAAKPEAGRKIIGWKIGLTGKAMQHALNTDVPGSGVLFDDMLFENGATVPAGRFIRPRVETEIAFVMKAPLAGKDLTRKDVIAAIGHVAPSLEILDTRIMRQDRETGMSLAVHDMISDNAGSAGLVPGPERHRFGAFDLRRVGAIAFRNGEVEETSMGAGVLNDPVNSVVWLARRMHRHDRLIEAGQIVLSGSFIRPLDCPRGAHIDADFGGGGGSAPSAVTLPEGVFPPVA